MERMSGVMLGESNYCPYHPVLQSHLGCGCSLKNILLVTDLIYCHHHLVKQCTTKKISVVRHSGKQLYCGYFSVFCKLQQWEVEMIRLY